MNLCGYCDDAKSILKKRARNPNVEVEFINGVGNVELEKRMKMIGQENYHYWPKIFLNNKFIGGYLDLRRLVDK